MKRHVLLVALLGCGPADYTKQNCVNQVTPWFSKVDPEALRICMGSETNINDVRIACMRYTTVERCMALTSSVTEAK